MLEMWKLRFRKVKQTDQDHGAIKWWNQDLDPNLLGSRAQVLKFYINCNSIGYNIDNKYSIKRKYNCFVKQSSKQEVASSAEKAMAPHSSTLAWKIPWMEEPGRL